LGKRLTLFRYAGLAQPFDEHLAMRERLQVLAQNRIVQPVLSTSQPLQAPWAVGLFNKLPILQRIPARIVGVGVRPEHVKSPVAAPTA